MTLMQSGLVCGSLILVSLVPSAGAATEGFDAGGAVERWAFHNGPEFPGASGAIRWNERQGRAGSGCLELEYSFAKGGNYVQATTPVPAGEAKVARVWLKKLTGHRITFRAIDSVSQTFQKGVNYDCPDWQQIEVDLNRWDSSYGGPGDHKVRPPLKQFGILIENTSPAKQGSLLIDDLEFLAQPTHFGTPVTYTALDFATLPDRDRGLLSLARSFAFSTDFSLLGEPLLMRIHLESDGSGRGVRIQLGSHFQSFEKQVGRLSTTPGEQVIEVPLGRLEGWEHHSGQNDGVARLPLRFRRISLDAGDGPPTGKTRLKKIDVVSLPRDGQLVVLVPDVRETAGQVQFSVKAINLRPGPVEGKLMCDIRSLGASLARRETDRLLGTDGQPAVWTVAHPMGDHRFIEAVFQWSDESFTSKPVIIGTCALPQDAGSSELRPESFVGAGLYLYRYQHTPNYKEPITRVCELARRAGVKWTREEIQWHSTEPEEGQFNWQFYDDVIEISRAHGISVYGLLCYWSRWSAKDTPEGVEQYGRWVRQVVRRYKDRIKHWEIWNEPNIFFWSGPRELYANMLAQAYDAIKAEDPEAVVMGCSTAGIDTDFIRKVMNWGGKFDALTIHPYRGEMNDLGFVKELQDVRRLVDGRDVWLTEIGFPSQLIDGWSERNQASLCARVYLCTAASGAGRSVSWYDFRNDGNDPFYNEMNFGLVRNDLRPKPGYGTLATLGRTLGDMRVTGSSEVGAEAYGFRFTDGSQDVVAVCAPARGMLLSYRAPTGVNVANAFGEAVEPVHAGDAATLTLDAGFPAYITGPAGFALQPVPPTLAYSLDASTARAGGGATLRIDGRENVELVGWDLPQGWPQPRKVGDNAWRIVVPEQAPAYQFDVQAVIRIDGGTLRLPGRVSVAPAVIRL